MMLHSVTILGKGNSKRLCPFDTDEVWGVNDVGDKLQGKRIDRLFAFDPLPSSYTESMKLVAPIMSWQPYADIPYPLEEIKKRFNTEYFSNSISYMLALAIYEKIPVIEIYGVDAAFGELYLMERSGVEYWIGRAEESGLIVNISKESHIRRTATGKIYGQGGDNKIRLYLMERLQLLNLLPFEGTYDEVVKSSLARWMVHVKENEAKIYDVKVAKQLGGLITYSCPEEFMADISLPPEVWDYVRGILIEIEKKGKLSVDAQTIYEKIVLGTANK